MSLLQKLSYKEYVNALSFSKEQCEKLARFADLDISFTNTTMPGEVLMKELDTRGLSVDRYNQLVSALNVRSVLTYYRPKSKVAILIANDKYISLSKLASPPLDCDALAAKLQNLGFIVVTLKNSTSNIFKDVLRRICVLIPEDSYCLIFYAGHGCQLCNTKCMLCIDCPTENMELHHCVTENFVLKELEKCKLDLCIFIMDMCRVYLDRDSNPKMYESMSTIEDFSIHKNLLISYSTQSSQAAYEVVHLDFSTSLNIDTDVTYELMTGDQERMVAGASQYVKVLCSRIDDDLDISSLLDKVHKDVEYVTRKQRPIKIQCGMDKRSLYDPTTGHTASLAEQLQRVSNDYSSNCAVLFK